MKVSFDRTDSERERNRLNINILEGFNIKIRQKRGEVLSRVL